MFCIRLDSLTSTDISGADTPRIVTRVTPLENNRAVNSSAKRDNWSAETGPDIITSVTRSRQVPLLTFGASAPEGRPMTASTATLTSSAALAISQSG